MRYDLNDLLLRKIMAGSLNWFRYQDDSATSYSIFIDESNARATVGGIQLCLNRSAASPQLPAGLKKRYLNATLTSNPSIKRRFYVGNPLAIPQILAGGAFLAGVYPVTADTAVAAVAWTITSYRGEKSKTPPALNATAGDTGLTDGTAPRDA
jgi:hypothetical protein